MPLNNSIIIISWLVASASIFYLRGVSNSAYLQPVIYSFILIFLLSTSRKTTMISSQMIRFGLVLLTMSYILALQLLFTTHQHGIINEFGRVAFPFLCLLVILSIDSWIRSAYSKDTYDKYLKRTIYVVVGFLLLDQIYRFYESGKIFPLESRYEMKSYSLLFIDSNFSGLIAAIILALNGKFFKYKKTLQATLYFLVIYSFSLAVYISILVSLVYKSQKKIKNTYVAIILSIILIIITLSGIVNQIIEDGSMQTKIEIMEIVIKNFILERNSIDLLIGIGFGNFKHEFDYIHASHNIFGLFAEGGILFLATIIYLFVWLFSISEKNHPALIILLVAGVFSLFPIAYCTFPFYLLSIKEDKIEKKQITR